MKHSNNVLLPAPPMTKEERLYQTLKVHKKYRRDFFENLKILERQQDTSEWRAELQLRKSERLAKIARLKQLKAEEKVKLANKRWIAKQRICKCGTTFTASKKKSKYCSLSCVNRYRYTNLGSYILYPNKKSFYQLHE